METRDELLAATVDRYRVSSRLDRGRILDEFAATTGYHRKHAMRLLRGGSQDRPTSRASRRLYDDRVRAALVVLWEASDRICGKRLKALLPILVPAMERHGHLDLDVAIRTSLLGMSAATIDRALQNSSQDQGSISAQEDGGLALAALAHDRVRAEPVCRRHHDRGAPDMLLRAVAIRNHGFKPGAIRGGHFDDDPWAHRPDSHAPTKDGIPDSSVDLNPLVIGGVQVSQSTIT